MMGLCDRHGHKFRFGITSTAEWFAIVARVMIGVPCICSPGRDSKNRGLWRASVCRRQLITLVGGRAVFDCHRDSIS